MVVASHSARPGPTQVSATAVHSEGWWLVCLVGAPEINVQVRRLSDVDAAFSEVLARDLGREQVDARVHIRWYDALHSVAWPFAFGLPVTIGVNGHRPRLS